MWRSLFAPLRSRSGEGGLVAWCWQFGRFAIVGSSNAAVDFLVYIALTRGSTYWAHHYLVANVLAFLVANVNSFVWNQRWTFGRVQGRHLWRQYVEFLLTSLIYFGLLQFGFWLAVAWGGWYDLWAKLVVTAVAVLLYFTCLRQWVFRPAQPAAR